MSNSRLKVVSIEKINQLKYLHSYKITYLSKSGKENAWELVSREGIERLENEIFKGRSYSDGSVIFATNHQRTSVVLLKEFRVSAGKYVYMLPAGLKNPGESVRESAVREFKEETGLEFELIEESVERYISIGIVNEKVSIVYGYYSGQPSTLFQEDHEDAEVIFVDRNRAMDLLRTQEVTLRTALLLESFFQLNPFMTP